MPAHMPRWWLLLRGCLSMDGDPDESGLFLLEWRLTSATTGEPITTDRRVYGSLWRDGDREILTFGLQPGAATLCDAVLSATPTPASLAARAGWQAAQTGRIGVWSKRVMAAWDRFEGDLRDDFHGGVMSAWKWRKTGTI